MKIISWNVQGTKKNQVLQEIKLLSSTHKPDMIFLLETLVNEKNISKILPTMGYDHFDYTLPSNHSGGIAVLWNNGTIHASFLSKESRAIHMLIHDVQKAQNCILSGIYAPAQEKEKNEFWNYLLELNTVFDLPWCLIGDFNELASSKEKIGGQSLANRKYNRLNSFTNSINAEPLHVKGRLFTRKKRIHYHLIYERLDRAIARNDWTCMYPDAFEMHGNFTCSNHCPIILATEPPRIRQKAFPFRFQNFWSNYHQANSIVKKQWGVTIQGTKMFQFSKKLKCIKYDLKAWAKMQFGNFHNKIALTNKKLTMSKAGYLRVLTVSDSTLG